MLIKQLFIVKHPMTNLEIFYLILPILFYSCSGIFDAIMDTLRDHFSVSIFSKLTPNFWNPTVSWTNKYTNNDPKNGHKYIKILGIKVNTLDVFSDAWHILKLIKEGFNILAIIAAVGLVVTQTQMLLLILTLVVARNIFFNLFYNFILKK